MSNLLVFNIKEVCDECGIQGAYNFIERFLCEDCMNNESNEQLCVHCSNEAKWHADPCDNDNHLKCTNHIVWCDDCVPLCEDCNENEPNKEFWRPCIEISEL